jgi:hypothetical protein
MNYQDLNLLIAECRRLFPREYERWSEIYPQRTVVFKMIATFPNALGPTLKALFTDSDEYRNACRYIEEQYSEFIDR